MSNSNTQAQDLFHLKLDSGTQISDLSSILSPWVSRVGNFPALFKPGPKSLGICLIKDSEARKASYFLANFLTSFFCLFNFFKSSALMWGIPASLASSQCC